MPYRPFGLERTVVEVGGGLFPRRVKTSRKPTHFVFVDSTEPVDDVEFNFTQMNPGLVKSREQDGNGDVHLHLKGGHVVSLLCGNANKLPNGFAHEVYAHNVVSSDVGSGLPPSDHIGKFIAHAETLTTVASLVAPGGLMVIAESNTPGLFLNAVTLMKTYSKAAASDPSVSELPSDGKEHELLAFIGRTLGFKQEGSVETTKEAFKKIWPPFHPAFDTGKGWQSQSFLIKLRRAKDE